MKPTIRSLRVLGLSVLIVILTPIGGRSDDVRVFYGSPSVNGRIESYSVGTARFNHGVADFPALDLDANRLRVYAIHSVQKNILLMPIHSGKEIKFLNFESSVELRCVAVSDGLILLGLKGASGNYRTAVMPLDDDGLPVTEDIIFGPVMQNGNTITDVAISGVSPSEKLYALVRNEIGTDTYTLVRAGSSYPLVHNYGESPVPFKIAGNATDLFVTTVEGVERRPHADPTTSSLVITYAGFQQQTGELMRGESLGATDDHIYLHSFFNRLFRSGLDGSTIFLLASTIGGPPIAAQVDDNERPRIVIIAPKRSKRIRGKRWAMSGYTTDDDPPLREVLYSVAPKKVGTKKPKSAIFEPNTGVWFFIHRFKASALKKHSGRVRFEIGAQDKGYKIFTTVRAHRVKSKKPRPRA